MTENAELENIEQRLYLIEDFLEQLMPLLIAASPARHQVVALLEGWAGKETSDPAEVRQGSLAELLLRAISATAGT